MRMGVGDGFLGQQAKFLQVVEMDLAVVFLGSRSVGRRRRRKWKDMVIARHGRMGDWRGSRPAAGVEEQR